MMVLYSVVCISISLNWYCVIKALTLVPKPHIVIFLPTKKKDKWDFKNIDLTLSAPIGKSFTLLILKVCQNPVMSKASRSVRLHRPFDSALACPD